MLPMLVAQSLKRNHCPTAGLIQIKLYRRIARIPDTPRGSCHISRSFNRCTLPEGPLGSPVTSLMILGALYGPSSRREKAAR